jgi:hypothetical protein
MIGSLVLWGTIVGGPVIWIVAMVDAHAIGNKLASGKPVGQWEFF